MKPNEAKTPEPQERLRELYRKNYLGLILLPPEAVADEFPELVRNLSAHRSPPQGLGDEPQRARNTSTANQGEIQ